MAATERTPRLATLTGRRGLGLRLFDNKYGTDYHEQVFAPWWQYARKHYLDLTGSETPTKTTLYYDPILDVHHRLPVRAALFGRFYSSAQAPDDARRLFDAASASAGLTADPLQRLRDVRGPAIALALSRKWRISDLEARLSRAIDAQFEPTGITSEVSSPGASAWARSIHAVSTTRSSPPPRPRLQGPGPACPQRHSKRARKWSESTSRTWLSRAPCGSTACSTSGSTSTDPIPPGSQPFGF